MKRPLLVQLIICAILICISGGRLCAQTDDKPQMKQLSEYQFQFNWLPLVAESYDVDEYKKLADLELMVDFLPQYNDYKAPYTSADIKATIVPVGDLHAVVYEYPEPKEIPLCLYEVFMPAKEQFDIFTLEKSLENEWVLGWQGTKMRGNYGTIERPATPEAFVECVVQILEKEKDSPKASSKD